MSYEVIGDKESLGQFASNSGYASLILAVKHTTAARALFESGESSDVDAVIADLKTIKEPGDERSTALGLAKMIDGEKSILISDGMT